MANTDIEARKQELLNQGYTEVYTKTKVLTDARVAVTVPPTVSLPK